MNELEFTSGVSSWINEIIHQEPCLPFSAAKCEMHRKGSLKRRDLSLLDKNHRIVLTGEVKLPYQKDGGSPFSSALVNDARRKAIDADTPSFFTWNVNEFVLWDTESSKESFLQRNYRTWDVTEVHSEDHLTLPMTEQAIKSWLPEFLREYARILKGTTKIGTKPPDEKFIEILESTLRQPIQLSITEMHKRHQNPKLRVGIERWMREDQGWLIRTDPEGVRELLERASKYACYSLMLRIVFYEALLKRYGEKLDKISVPLYIDTGEALHNHLIGYFDEAKKATRDYETVFGEDHHSVGSRIPFYSDSAVVYWRSLITQIHDFDFSKLDYEIIGILFEQLISGKERHKFGQFYTRAEVVDLINSFCIRDGNEKLMDPAAGGGTFLVRAYARKRALIPSLSHSRILKDLYGVDVDPFATHLTTINLATRNLIDEENYPQIARSDFFDVKAGKAFLKLPRKVISKGLGKIQHRDVEIDLLDAVVGNPPYVRTQDIPQQQKGKMLELVAEEESAKLSARSDMHCYFWPHAASFLKNDGYLCFLTSSQWLDVGYGFSLQKWILENFRVIAVIESTDEPWFVGARVQTAVTILQRDKNESARRTNTVRFIQLRRPLRDIVAHDGTTMGAVETSDAFRDEVLSAQRDTTNENYRIRLVSQGALMMDGGWPDYRGGKWGIHLRAPDMWFEITERCKDNLSSLGEIADISSGVLSGKDDYFLPVDCSGDCLEKIVDEKEFMEEYGVPRKDVEKGRISLVLCGDDREILRPIESQYLAPEVHALNEVDGFTVESERLGRKIIVIGRPKDELQGTYAGDYIAWGEQQGWHKATACASRATDRRPWYDLSGLDKGLLLWPKAQQYKHVVPINELQVQNNYNLHGIRPKKGLEPELLAGILNSSFVILSKYQYGRPVGVEGNLKTEIADIERMLIPDPRKCSQQVRGRIISAFRKMKGRKVLQLLSERRLREMAYRNKGQDWKLAALSDESELDMPDRWKLDAAVLDLMVSGPAQYKQTLLNELHRYLKDFFEQTRQKEEKALVNKQQQSRKRPLRPKDMAVQIFGQIKKEHPGLLKTYESDFFDRAKPFDTVEIPLEGVPNCTEDLVDGSGVRFTKGRKSISFVKTRNATQSELVALIAESGRTGVVRIPYEEEECRQVSKTYRRHVEERNQRLKALLEERTKDGELQRTICESLLPFIVSGPSD